MTYQSHIAELIPAGAGDVLWLDQSHATQLAHGMPASPGIKRAVVLENLLGMFADKPALLRRIASQLGGGGVVIAVVAPRANPMIGSGFTRQELLRAFEAAGYDVISCALIPDDRVPWRPVAISRDGGEPLTDESEEAGAAAIVVAGRRTPIAGVVCSVVVAGAMLPYGLDRAGVTAEVLRVEPWAGETRAQAWNRGARIAGGEYLAFVAGDEEASTPPLIELLEAARRMPAIGAAGSRAVGFGPVMLPCHQLPYPLATPGPGPVPAVAGDGIVMRRRLFVEVGGFDPDLGAALDGPDLCLRLRARGLAIWCTAAPPVAAKQDTTGVRRFVFKWRGQLAEDPPAPAPATPPAVASTSRHAPPAPLLWTGPLLERSGYGEEARGFVLALDRLGVDVQANVTDWRGAGRTAWAESSRLGALVVDSTPERFVHVVHSFPVARMMIGGSSGVFPLVEHFKPDPRAVWNIGRTMYETDRIPQPWVEYCNAMDEVWVPSEFNVDTFSRAGVQLEKLFRIPGAVDTTAFDPKVPPAYIPGAGSFVFLSVFAWSLRKGWDALVRAYMEEFGPTEDVTLVLKVLPLWNRPAHRYRAELEAYLRESFGLPPGGRPRILLDGRELSTKELARMYRAASAFVLASRGESYGRPFLEAMAMGLPTIGTRCGGNVDFMNEDNSYLVTTQMVAVPDAGLAEVPDYRAHRWAEPDVADLRRAMRRVFEQRREAAAKGAEARRYVLAHHAWRPVGEAIVARLEASGVHALRARRKPSIAVRWEGPQSIAFGLAEVNREMVRAFEAESDVDLLPCETATPRPWLDGRPPQVTVRHRWPPDMQPPATGRWVMYQPWEYGSLPAAWVEPINRLVGEAWVPSRYVRDCYVRSGVDPGKVAVVPYGIDPDRFHPRAKPIDLPTTKRHRFLFVGGTIARKGIDILLDTYVRTFSPDEDVCLVIKDLGARSFYGGQNLGAQIQDLISNPAHPEIIYLDRDLPAADMPGLYAACTCLVHPYRGEGFGLPIAEAMACGLPVIVPRHGACLDFCDEKVALMVRAREVRMPEAKLGETPTVEPGWWAEVDRATLARAMRRVVAKPQAARALGRRASERVRKDFTWANAARAATLRIANLAARHERITACVIALDEARYLARCLKSLRGLVDEVIVVDTGSKDRTVEVATGLGAKVWSAPWTGDFAAARNESLRHATGDWVLVIDADEWLDEAGRRELRAIAAAGARDCHLVRQVSRSRSNPDGVERQRLRFFPNRPGLRFEGAAFERLVESSGGTPQAQPSGVVVHHDGSAPSRRRRVRRALPAMEREAGARPEMPRLGVELSIAYSELGLATAAEHAAASAVERLRGRPQDDAARALLPDAVVQRARALVALARYGEAEQACRRALAIDPGYADAHALLARALAAQDLKAEAAASFSAALVCLPRAAGVMADRGAAGALSRYALAALGSP